MRKFYNALKTIKPSLARTVCYYTPLLECYARRLINNEWEAILLVNSVLKDQYEIDRLAPSDHLRQVVKFDLCICCFYFNQSLIFDRNPIGIPLRPKIDEYKFPVSFDNQKRL